MKNGISNAFLKKYNEFVFENCNGTLYRFKQNYKGMFEILQTYLYK